MRVYTEADLSRINRVKELLQLGYKLSAAFQQSRQELEYIGAAA